MNNNRNIFIQQLPIEYQNTILEKLVEYYTKYFRDMPIIEIVNKINDIMCDRVWVLEDTLPELLIELNI